MESRILDAAHQLWRKIGEKSPTMRAVTRAAATSTPTMYQRFPDKRDILEILRRSAQ
jgi:AcrR family transcriptional regulator